MLTKVTRTFKIGLSFFRACCGLKEFSRPTSSLEYATNVEVSPKCSPSNLAVEASMAYSLILLGFGRRPLVMRRVS